MTPCKQSEFGMFFQALWGQEPLPWQSRLATVVCAGNWPEFIDLPTASGKTACLDIAVFALAVQASRPSAERTQGRRVIFVVNRRVIVDEAHDRAVRIARALASAGSGSILYEVAQALRGLSGDAKALPLDVALLRGGIVSDNRWARSIAQPTIVTSTVDQVGSRLLFRGYGVSAEAAPMHAALLAHDSTILLDEAHISRPFVETLHTVARYRAQGWAEEPIRTPFDFVQMTATPSEDGSNVFRLDELDLAHPVLVQRHARSKPVQLCIAAKAKGKKALVELANELAVHAIRIQSDNRHTVAVIVNRVATARAVFERLLARIGHPRSDGTLGAEVHLAIGRMRPVDRDKLSDTIRSRVGKSRAAPTRNEAPLFVVATQCLEVGADFDFDAMVCECASIDALRQRFGRLNRMGRELAARGLVVIRADQVTGDDPIYGSAVAQTWSWLQSVAQDEVVDFGINTMNRLLPADPAPLLAPRVHAPVLFPAYLDLWAQTSRPPVPDPDVALFLHGPNHGEPDVNVCWRDDLPEELDEDEWCQIVSLCPPSVPECMSVPIGLVRAWLANDKTNDEQRSEVLGAEFETEEELEPTRRIQALAWRGADRSKLIRDPSEVRPGDTIVLPARLGGWNVLGHIPGDAPVDVAEPAYRASRGRVILRLTPSHREIWSILDRVVELKDWVLDSNKDLRLRDLRDLLGRAAELCENERQDVADALRSLANRDLGLEYERYPNGVGVVLKSRKTAKPARSEILPPMDDGEDETSRSGRETPVRLDDHLKHVREELDRVLNLLPTHNCTVALEMAADIHDWGKADERFQALLIQGDRQDACAQPALWGKSARAPISASQRREARERCHLPAGFRHEMLSCQLANLVGNGRLADDSSRDLVLHLIASHHGRGRALPPIVLDGDPPDVSLESLGIELRLTGNERKLNAAHRLDSDISERFWKLTKRFGWWGLAYLETVLRLADQRASQREEDELHGTSPSRAQVHQLSRSPIARTFADGLVLSGLDGSNPLAFLAAIGALRALTQILPDEGVRMRWIRQGGMWRPEVFANASLTDDRCATLLHSSLSLMNGHVAFSLGDNLNVSSQAFREYALECVQHTESSHDANRRIAVDFAAAFACDAVVTEQGVVQDTALRTMSGAGHQHFLAFMRRIVENTTLDHLRKTLFQPWKYDDSATNQTLRWDPADDSRYALQWRDPSGDPARKKGGAMLGANRLAIEGLPLLTCVPVGSDLRTVGFSGRGARATYFTWPIWSPPISINVCRSLLALPELVELTAASTAALREMGIAAAFRSQRITIGKFRNFTPSTAVV